MADKQRNYGIDLLRIVLMYMICLIHALGRGGILTSENGTPQFYVLWLFESFAFCAVNAFGIISGYMSTSSKSRTSKIVEMWFQAFFYSFILTILLLACGVRYDISIADIMKCMIPMSTRVYWYFSGYFALFFAMPFLYRIVDAMDISTAKKALIILFLLFSRVIGDPFLACNGYSTIWLFVLYCIGLLMRKTGLFASLSSKRLIVLLSVCTILTWAARVFAGTERLLMYVSPTVLLSGMIMVVLFSRININCKIVKKLSPYMFGVYLLQLSPVVWDVILKGRFSFLKNKNALTIVIGSLVFSFVIFALGTIIEWFRSKLAAMIQIPKLSNYIAKACENGINRLIQKI